MDTPLARARNSRVGPRVTIDPRLGANPAPVFSTGSPSDANRAPIRLAPVVALRTARGVRGFTSNAQAQAASIRSIRGRQ